MEQTLTERYAAPSPWRRRVTIAIVAVVAVVSLGWLAWAIYGESTPKVESQLSTFTVVDEHSVRAQIDVRVGAHTTGASCTVEALASDHSIVGELHFTPVDGTNDVTVRTERIATSIELSGCIAPGQDRPR